MNYKLYKWQVELLDENNYTLFSGDNRQSILDTEKFTEQEIKYFLKEFPYMYHRTEDNQTFGVFSHYSNASVYQLQTWEEAWEEFIEKAIAESTYTGMPKIIPFRDVRWYLDQWEDEPTIEGGYYEYTSYHEYVFVSENILSTCIECGEIEYISLSDEELKQYKADNNSTKNIPKKCGNCE